MVEGRGVIEARKLSKTFIGNDGKEMTALEDFDLTIGAGEFVTLLGPSGCGKSTFLRIVAGLESPTSGEILLDGEPVAGTSFKRGLVFQSPKLFPWLNVYENVAFGLKSRGIYEQQRDRVEEFIEMVGLTGFEREYPHHLSGGMAQRTALARALVNSPEVLCLDEPLAALDAFLRVDMQDELLNIWARRKITVVMVSHDVEEAAYLSDRIVVMKPRPGKMEKTVAVSLPRPRDRESREFTAIRKEVLKGLDYKADRKDCALERVREFAGTDEYEV